MRRLQLALCGGGIYSTNTVQTCTCGLVPSIALAHILHAQIATCTVMVVHGGCSGVMEVVPWNGSMW